MVPPRGVIDRHGYIRQIIPPALAQGQRLPPPRLAPNAKVAQVNLNRPNFVPAPKNVPRLTATIPRVQPVALQPGRGLPGTALPTKATMPLTPQMTQQIQKLPPQAAVCAGRKRSRLPRRRRPSRDRGRPGMYPGSTGTVPAWHPDQAWTRFNQRSDPAGPGATCGSDQTGSGTTRCDLQPVRLKPGEFHPGVRPGTPTDHRTAPGGHEAQRRLGPRRQGLPEAPATGHSPGSRR